ncbi:PLANT BROAD-SPECTRUM MILDEW RESISTANCE PROTEIN RPW8 [Salix koriyanagi]|uniref:PLANT BROAD-SPECTRUM MILDEW RESISTANCE PROTEIN RPW8 n=1 Tax=Salix koriyanagi TaxID=2511006 RepID=A0A9Q0UN90_9ROSI|nr:PLANT BROAD-SPECTRUM MILDEW RESISTANCE PROTEIN RPW8 [Salix koriyanagi]
MAFVLTAAVGTLLGELLHEVWELKKKGDMFETVLESMEITLTSVTQALKKIKGLNKELDRENDKEIWKLWKQLEKGKKLVNKYKQAKCSSCLKRPFYMKDLEKLDDSLKRFSQIVMPVLQSCIQMETLLVLEDNREELIETHEDVKDIQEEVQHIHEEVKRNHEVVRDINEGVRDIHEDVKQVKEIDQKVKDIHTNVEGISDRVNDIHVEVKEVKEVREEVKGTHDGVKDIQVQVKKIHEEVIDMHKDLRSNIQAEKAASPVSNNNVNFRPFMPPEPPRVIVGLDKPMKDLKSKLFNDGISTVVLTGPGGSGKTTLAKKLCHDEAIKEKYKDNIFFITVSKSPDLKIIIQQLFRRKGHSVHEFRTDEEAVHSLEQLLKQIGTKPILLVLDDVWSGSESLVDKFKFQIPGYKILLTSRSSLRGFDSKYKLDTLNYEDSLSLFRQTAELQNSTSNKVEDDVVKKIVKFCKGFPLALTVVGRSLRQQQPAVWKTKVKQWSNAGAFIESNNDLLACLKTSLDAMDNKLKECYVDLGAFPEGQLIPASAIIDMWEELYEMNGDGLNSISNLHELSSFNLIDLVETRTDENEREDYSETFVTQHGLLRDLVIHLSGLVGSEQGRKNLVVDINGDEFPGWWKQQEHQTIMARVLSITTDETFKSSWPNIQAPEVEVLVLNFRTKKYSLPKFIKSMDKLKTLILTNYGFFSAEISNFMVLGNLSNLKRIRLEQVSIHSLTMHCDQLENLQKISLIRCNIVPSGSDKSIRISDALPKLEEINIGYCDSLIELPC